MMNESVRTTGVSSRSNPDAIRRISTGGEAVAEQLVLDDVDVVFGVPGIQLDYLIDGLAQRADRLRFISCRHEQGAAYMADGYARAGGKPGVFTVVPGPGVLNATAGLATAYSCSSPVVCLAGQIATWAINGGVGLLHDVHNQDAVLRSVTKRAVRGRTPTQLPALTHAALGDALGGRPRPVAVELPDDLLKASFDGELAVDRITTERVVPDPRLVSRAAALLARAEHPVIYAGGGVLAADASDALTALAATLRAPVVTSQNGRGAVSDHNPWALTTLGGRKVVPAADALLVVGSRGLRMDGSSLFDDVGAAHIIVNADPNDLAGDRRPDAAIHADARLGVEALLAEITASKSTWTTDQLDEIRGWCAEQIATVGDGAEWVSALRRGMPEDAILVGELTQMSYLTRVAFPVYQPRTNITAGYMGTLGYGVATAIGARLARPQTPVVSISGDGGFCYAMAELLTAVKYDVPVVFVVFNDEAYGNVLRTQLEQFEGRVNGSRLTNPEFMDLATAFGIPGIRAKRPEQLVDALREAIRSTGPVLIEVPVGELADPGPLVREMRAAGVSPGRPSVPGSRGDADK